jgi:hypothetical protein
MHMYPAIVGLVLVVYVRSQTAAAVAAAVAVVHHIDTAVT